MNILNLAARPITLTDADTSHPIALTLNQIQQQLTHYPPSDYAWETAIQTVEDALYPLRDLRQNTQPLAVQGAAPLLALPHQAHPRGAIITTRWNTPLPLPPATARKAACRRCRKPPTFAPYCCCCANGRTTWMTKR